MSAYHVHAVPMGAERVLDLLKLEFTDMCRCWKLNLRSSRKVVSALNH